MTNADFSARVNPAPRISRTLLVGILLLASSTATATAATAQPSAAGRAQVVLNAAGLLSVGTRDDTYAFPPYVSEALGGAAPGLSVGIGYLRGHLALLGEFSSAFLTKTLVGRSVGGSDYAVGQGSRPDTLLSGLFGVSLGGDARRVNVYAGLSAQLRRPTLDGYSLSDSGSSDPANVEGASRVAFTTGADVTRRLSPRWSLVGTFRYSLVPTSRRANELGIGEHLFRVGAGVSVALSR